MTMFGMPPSDPEGLRPGVDEAVGDPDESVIDVDAETEADQPPAERHDG